MGESVKVVGYSFPPIGAPQFGQKSELYISPSRTIEIVHIASVKKENCFF